jgi:hypothetical protein
VELSGLAHDHESAIGPEPFNQSVENAGKEFAVLTFLQQRSRDAVEKSQVFGGRIFSIESHVRLSLANIAPFSDSS